MSAQRRSPLCYRLALAVVAASSLAVVPTCNPPSDVILVSPDALENEPVPGVIYTYGAQEKLFPNVVATTVFGTATAIDRDTLVVGATVEQNDQGRVYVFVRSGNDWVLQQKLQASDPTNGVRFGIQVAISGDTLIAGASGSNGNRPQGAAYVFVRSGTTWTQQQKITAADGLVGDRFGQSVELSGDTAVIGAPGDDAGATPDVGSAYIFVRSGTTWSLQQKLTAPDGVPLLHDYFGYGVAIQGNTVAIGARTSNNDVNRPGRVFVFVRSGTVWNLQQTLAASDSSNRNMFGRDLSLSGESLLIGASQRLVGGNGAAYVFVRTGTTWSEQQKLTANDGASADLFGGHVALSGDTAAVGAKDDDDNGGSSGSMYLFKRIGTTWTQDQKLKPSDGQTNDRFTQDMALFGNTVVGGSRGDDDLAGDSGAVYVFEQPGIFNGSFETGDYTGWTLKDISAGPDFGIYGIASDGQTINSGENVFDFADQVTVNTGGVGPITYEATHGTRVAFQIQPNGPPPPESHRMFQTVTIPATCGQLQWEMKYNSLAPLDDASQFTALNIRDVATDTILATPFKLGNGAAQTVATMTSFSVDLSAFAGQIVRLDFEHRVLASPFEIAWDNIRIDCAPNGTSCGAPTGCSSGNCVDGVCCDTGCGGGTAGDCQRCDLAASLGTCSPEPAATACGSGLDDECTEPDTCDTVGVCQPNHATSGSACGSGLDDECTNPDTCNAGSCLANHAAAGAACGDQGVPCAIDDNCNGSGVCVDNGFEAAGTPCRAIAGPCDVEEVCDGVGSGCDADGFVTAGGAGDPSCAPLTCNGTQAACPIEPFVAVAAELAFGSRRVGTTSPPQPLVVTNTGTASLSITSVTIGAPFIVTAPTGTVVVAPDETTTIEVTFSPTAPVLSSGQLVITSNATASPANVTITGTGTVPGLTPSTSSLAFGTVKIGTQSAAQSFTLTNTGGASTSITAANAPAGFAVEGPPLPVSLLVDGQATFTVTFNPTLNGVASGDITFASDAALVPTIAITGTGGTPMVVPNPTSLSFGLVPTGGTSNPQMITLQNVSDIPLVIAEIVSAPPFVRTSVPLPATVPAGGQLPLGVLFSPTSGGQQSGTLTINSDGGTLVIPLDGEGLAPEPPPGGGCCSTGGGKSSTSALLGLAVLGALRRRRRT